MKQNAIDLLSSLSAIELLEIESLKLFNFFDKEEFLNLMEEIKKIDDDGDKKHFDEHVKNILRAPGGKDGIISCLLDYIKSLRQENNFHRALSSTIDRHVYYKLTDTSGQNSKKQRLYRVK